MRPVGAQRLGEALRRERNDRVGGREDGAARTIVVLQRHHMRRRIERARKIQDVAHRRGAEGVDRLRIIADNGQAASIGSEREHDLALQSVGVLVFIDQQMIEAPCNLRRDRRLSQHLGEVEQEVIVIEHVLALLHLDVRREQSA